MGVLGEVKSRPRGAARPKPSGKPAKPAEGKPKRRTASRPVPKRDSGRVPSKKAVQQPVIAPLDQRWAQRALQRAENTRDLFLYPDYLGGVEWLIRQFPAADYPQGKVGEFFVPFLETIAQQGTTDELTESALKMFLPTDLEFMEAESGLPRNYLFAIIDLLPEEVKQLPPDRQIEFVAIVLGLIHKESSFDELQVSKVGAVGPMQVMPETARDLEERVGLPLDDFERSLPLHDPRKNLKIGMFYLYRLYRQLGGDATEESFFSPTMRRALIAYNGGKGYLRKHSPEKVRTNQYQRRIMAVADLYLRFCGVEIDTAWHLAAAEKTEPVGQMARLIEEEKPEEPRRSPFSWLPWKK